MRKKGMIEQKIDNKRNQNVLIVTLAHGYGYIVFGLARYVRDDMTVYFDTVYGKGNNTLFYILRVLYRNVVNTLTECSG